MKLFFKSGLTVSLTLLFGVALNCQAQNRDQIKYKCAVEAGPIQDAQKQQKVYDQCLSLKGYVRDDYWERQIDLFDQPIMTKAEKLRDQERGEKQHQQHLQEEKKRLEAEKKRLEQCEIKLGRKCSIVLENEYSVTDGEGYLLNDEMLFSLPRGFFDRLRDDPEPAVNTNGCCRRDVLCAIPLRPGVEYRKSILWSLGRYCGRTSNQESSSKPSNQKPSPPVPPPHQVPKLDILKKNSNLVLECIVVSQIFRRSAEERNADADLKKITSALAGRFSEYGAQIFEITDALRAKGDEIGEQFRQLDKDAQVGKWQRCNQWQP